MPATALVPYACSPTPPGPEQGPAADLWNAGFARAVDPHVPRLVRVARGILGSEDLAWDAVQETLMALWRTGEAPPTLRAWLLRAVTHRSVHLLRTRTRCRKHEERAAACRAESCTCHEPSRLAEGRELCSDLERALAQLPGRQRLLFLLREVEQLDYEAIAQALGVPVGTIRSRLNRARVALREILRCNTPEEARLLPEEQLSRPRGTKRVRAALPL